MAFGLRYSYGVFVAPVSSAMGWGRDVFSLAIALQNLFWGMAQPVAGALADRHGISRVMWGGTLLSALAMLGASFARSPLEFCLLLGVLTGVAQSGFGLPLIVASFGRIFPEERRSQAIGLATASSSLGQFLIVPLVQLGVVGLGWQGTLWMMALVIASLPFLGLPLGKATRPPSAARDDTDLRLADALRGSLGSSSFRLVLIGFFVCGFHVTFIVVHMPGYLLDLGFTASLGAWAIGVIGLCNIFGSWGAGWLGARYSKRLLLCALYAARAVIITLFLLLPPSPLVVLLFSVGMGLLWLGTIPLTSGLVVTLCGTRYISTLFGLVFFSHQVGAFLGVWLAGLLHHWGNGYEAIWWAAVLFSVIASVLHWPIRERRLAWALSPA